MDLTNKTIAVTGHSGFLGRHVMDILQVINSENVVGVNRHEYNLLNWDDVYAMYKNYRPQIVIHLAAVVGGIQANQAFPGSFFYANSIMGIQLMELARSFNVEKFVTVGTVCCYPKYTLVPFKEEDIWDGYPEETNAPYGLAKKMLLVQSQAYRQQYGFNSIFLIPTNMYGPYDNFNETTSHVIPALIKKCFNAIKDGRDEIFVWGTGEATREFLFVEDCAEAIVQATSRYDSSEPVNIGTGVETSMKDLVALITKLTGFKGKVIWDSSKPDGQPRRCLNTLKALEYFGFQYKTSLEDGLKRTIDWYMREKY